jgi:hypothetical protein
MKFNVLHLFTTSGKTYTFRNGEIVVNNETNIVIKYSAMSDGQVKVGTFFWTNLVGYSVAALIE